jgi:hypothetical protein
MIDDDAPIDEELTRRLHDLAATTTLDPDAWGAIVARTSGAGVRVTRRCRAGASSCWRTPPRSSSWSRRWCC